MTKTTLLALVLAAACGGPKKQDPIAPPSGSGEDPTANIPNDPAPPAPPKTDDTQLVDEAKKFLAEADATLRKVLVASAEASWANETDLTDAHEAAAAKATQEVNDVTAGLIKRARKYERVMNKLDASSKRQLQNLIYMMTVSTPIAPSPDDPKQAEELAKIAAEMASIYGKGKVCDPKTQPARDKKVAGIDKRLAAITKAIETAKDQKARDAAAKQVEKLKADRTKAEGEGCRDLTAIDKILQKTRKPEEALALWQGWHDKVGRAERDLFAKYVPLANAGAKAIGFANVSEMWKSSYDMSADAFEAETDRLYGQMKPLYEQLHCYTRAKLNKMYGEKAVPLTGAIPAHLTGNMWAQSWGWLYKSLEPFPGQPPIDVTQTLEKGGKRYDEQGMTRVGEAFYTSLGFPTLPSTFWERSMFSKPKGKEAVCHASAWDVSFNNDLRIKMCIQRTHEELDVIHHELGHNYYQMAYHKEPILIQNGANDGFHEAIGDTVVLSMTPDYLKEKGLLAKVTKNDKVTINRQMNTALEKIAFLPWGLLVDKWRWDVFAGKVKPDEYNKHWWDLRLKYQGVAPPVARAATDFDPGAKFHVPANVPYMRYFLAAILQFQFHRALCKKAGHTGPLNECSIYNNKVAGEAYWKMLQRGAAQPWQDTLFELTGQREMDATAMLEYFAPLKGWLEEQNKGQKCGW
ncbi:MAG: M2 family metallopeptidase [Myxococcota bacterium]|nr:M2 family metallopeptidase [Myxococcota bacterium]